MNSNSIIIDHKMKSNFLCGTSFCHPQWMQRFANTKSFIIVYGFLGTTQAMAYIYFVITLTTLERRFKIPSQTTGFILSGNEISQILLSLILSYIGGQRNRPRWIAWGVLFCSLSCFILAAPHFIYGAGDEVLQLTKEYTHASDMSNLNDTVTDLMKSQNRLCLGRVMPQECDELFSVLPLVLIFLSQFVLGIGNTLYYSLGQSYLDDNTKKTNTPLLLGYAMSLRMFGPVVGFVLGYVALKIFVDPSKTPLIDSKDPRWIGAWWLGWIILGFAMLFFAVLIGLFPKELPKQRNQQQQTPQPHMLEAPASLVSKKLDEEEKPLNKNGRPVQYAATPVAETPVEKAKLKDFPTALMRLLKNKLLMCNIFSGIFYILGSSGYITFLSKYFEVQFHKNAADATIISGPITLIGMVSGFLLSGIVISKKKPGPRYLLFWNVIVGMMYMVGQVSYMFLTCPDGKMPVTEGRLNLSTTCNLNCNCEGLSYSPVCHEQTGNTFFSPCHAGCGSYDQKNKFYSDCHCVNDGATRLIMDYKPQRDDTLKNESFDVLESGIGFGKFAYKTENTTTKQPLPPIVSAVLHRIDGSEETLKQGPSVEQQETVGIKLSSTAEGFSKKDETLTKSTEDTKSKDKMGALSDLSMDEDDEELPWPSSNVNVGLTSQSKDQSLEQMTETHLNSSLNGQVKMEPTTNSKSEDIEEAFSELTLDEKSEKVSTDTKPLSKSKVEIGAFSDLSLEEDEAIDAERPVAVESSIMKIPPRGSSQKNESSKIVETTLKTEKVSIIEESSGRNEEETTEFKVLEQQEIGDVARAGGDSDQKKAVYDDYDYRFYEDVDFDDSKRNRRATPDNDEKSDTWADMTPGACLKGCAVGFYAFVLISTLINCFGASGKIGNLLVNYRCVSTQDKSFTQGLILMLISLFALIPGPIMYGHIIDSTCIIWSEKCGKRGNCQLYDQRSFRLYINMTALVLTSIGVFFDVLVWHYGKNLVLYDDVEEDSTKLAPTDQKAKEEAEKHASDNNGFVKT